jgi:hypothetical protein
MLIKAVMLLSRVLCVTIDGVWFVNRFIDHLQVITKNNYNTIANFTLYSSLEHTVWCTQSVTWRFLVTVPTMAIPLPPDQVLSSQAPIQNWLSSNLVTRHKPHRKHSSSIIPFKSDAAGTCLPSCCPETALLYPPIPRSLHSNGSTSCNISILIQSERCMRMFVIS